MNKDKVTSLCNKIIEYALYALMIVTIFSRALIELSLILIITVWLIRLIITQSVHFSFSYRLIVFPFLFLLSGATGLIFSANRMASLRELFNMIEFFLLFLVVSDIASSGIPLRRFVYTAFSIAILIAVDGLFQFFTGKDIIRLRPSGDIEGIARLTASFSHPNNLGGYLAVFIPSGLLSLLFYPFTEKKTQKQAVVLVVLLSLLFISAMTYSRGTWLALFTAISFFLLVRNIPLLLTSVVLIIVLSFFLPDFFLGRIKDIVNIHNVTSQTRLDTWKKALEMISAHPLIGNGLKSFSRTYGEGYTHNCYLQILAEAGFFGLISYCGIFLTFLYTCLKRYFVNKKDSSSIFLLGVASGIIAFGVHSLIDTNLFSMPLAVSFWTLLGIACALIYNKDSNERIIHEK